MAGTRVLLISYERRQLNFIKYIVSPRYPYDEPMKHDYLKAYIYTSIVGH